MRAQGGRGSAGSIGLRVASWRQRRGVALNDLASRTRIPIADLRGLESGRDWVDRLQLLAALANGLRLDPSDLTGQPYAPSGDIQATVRAAAFRLRRHAAEGTARPVGGIDLADLSCRTADLQLAERSGDEYALAKAIPDVVAATDHAASSVTSSGEGKQVSRIRAEAHAAAAGLMRRLGYKDLSWTLLHRLRAEETGCPAVLVEEVRLLLDLGLAQRAADRALSGPPIPGLLFAAAVAHAVSGAPERADQKLTSAEALATEPREHAKVQASRVAVAVESGAFDEAHELARSVDLTSLTPADSTEFLMLAATAAARQGDVSTATALLSDADSSAPLRFRLHPFARDILAVLPSHADRAGDIELLGGLSERAGTV